MNNSDLFYETSNQTQNLAMASVFALPLTVSSSAVYDQIMDSQGNLVCFASMREDSGLVCEAIVRAVNALAASEAYSKLAEGTGSPATRPDPTPRLSTIEAAALLAKSIGLPDKSQEGT